MKVSFYKKDWRSLQKQEKLFTGAQVGEQHTSHAKRLPVFMFVYKELMLLFCDGQILKGPFRNQWNTGKVFDCSKVVNA